jgi:hypothetical protein
MASKAVAARRGKSRGRVLWKWEKMWNFSKIGENFRWIFSQIQRILNGFSPKFGEFQMDFLLIQRILNGFLPNSEDFRRIFSRIQRILDGVSLKFGENFSSTFSWNGRKLFSKSRGGDTSHPPTARAAAVQKGPYKWSILNY